MSRADAKKMMRLLVVGALLCLAAWSGASGTSETTEQQPVDPRSLKFPPLEFKAPKADRTVLPNGMVVYTLEDHFLPIINVTSAINTGEMYVPAEKAGLASLTGDVMRTGGTKKMTGDDVDKALDYVAASVSVSIGRDRGTAAMFCLRKDFDSILPIFAEILVSPAFARDKIDKRKKELMESFRRENDEPEEIVGREFRRLVYKEHPYARRETGYPETIERIGRDDMLAFHANFFHPKNIILGISGDFEKKEMLQKLEEVFTGWERCEIDFPPVPEMPASFERSLNYIRKDINQSSVLLGHIGLERLNPDFYAVSVMNFILGADFTSRLVENVRTKGGLAYSVGSVFEMPKYKGMFFCYFDTANPQTRFAVEKTVAELERIRSEKVSEEEFKRAKDALSNRFVFTFATSRSVVEKLVSIEYEGLPRDYLDTYLDKVAAVTPDDALRVAQKYIHPESITLLVVGDEEALRSFPENWGKFNTIGLSSPPSEAEGTWKEGSNGSSAEQ